MSEFVTGNHVFLIFRVHHHKSKMKNIINRRRIARGIDWWWFYRICLSQTKVMAEKLEFPVLSVKNSGKIRVSRVFLANEREYRKTKKVFMRN